ncbi:MAG: glucosamine-6-phosphate deaminase [Lachnospiraceae bacterium]|nr:glucosamine-6-phosphate deaminase [Lachnospiraceae bacterium]
MIIIKTKNYEELSRKAADIIGSVVVLKSDAVLGLATGSTPVGTYKELIKDYEAGKLDFAAVKSVNLDEYKGLTGDHDQSYRYFMNTNLFDHVNIDKANTNVPSGIVEDGEAECERYNQLIKDLGGIDLQLLGIGGNAHIGFNEPCDEFVKGTHLVTLEEDTRVANARFFASLDEVPTQAYTMGIQNIMSAKKILLLANGKAKAQAVYDTCFGPVKPQVPASILQLHEDCIVIADEDALSLCVEKGLV